LALDGGEWLASHPGRFTPKERAPDTHWTGGFVGTRAVLDAVVKRKIPSPRRETNVNIHVLGKSINTIKKKREALLDPSREVGLEVNRELNIWLCLVTRMRKK